MTVRNSFKQLMASLRGFVDSLFKGSARPFKPTDDNYPATGVQPFEGETPR
jgi:hypothetical protein